MTRGYGTDLAFVHDAGFTEFTRSATAAVIAATKRAGIRRGLVVDLACGSGVSARALCRAGYDVLGIDISPAMIALARRRAPGATFRRGSLLRMRLPRCVAVIALGEAVSYGFDARAGSRALRVLFRRVHAALSPGGLLVFDVAAPGRGAGGAIRYHSGDGWAVVSRATEDRRILTREITVFRRVGRRWRWSDEVHRLVVYRPADIVRWLQGSGFRVQVARAYGRFRLARGWVGFVARKPTDRPQRSDRKKARTSSTRAVGSSIAAK